MKFKTKPADGGHTIEAEKLRYPNLASYEVGVLCLYSLDIDLKK
jgi:hypothetical protein